MPSQADIEAYKKASNNANAFEYKPDDFVSPGSGATGGRKKLDKKKINSSSERFASCDDWLSPGASATNTPGSKRRSWKPKDPKLQNLSLFDM
eukprot:CAMPEP_0117029790 /NCGR_PEP_ID=MMETSP0472-20121206/21535_1 /TAXON_ID=693140 ORGANISM="Tiarina fusus, Strain LIS" /NCGR_SAMPLE_ID=MMETSP0472 /ASSEMBLY_ACC=CAM_ASM_000603 /LENGTH=92 /DNA_ID=CAMNT_0004737641 /DNA_START=67 /DNA_END=345 /DNA_ORIENTATION=-